MDDFWKDIMDCLLDILYHGAQPDDGTWHRQYEQEMSSMIDDVKNFHRANTEAGFEVSNESLSHFLVYAEQTHIGNSQLIRKCPVDTKKLYLLAAQINDGLS